MPEHLSGLSEMMQISSKALAWQNIEPIKMPEIRDYHLADYQYEVLLRAIADFEAELDDNHEVVAKLASFGQSVIISIDRIGYSNPSLVHFHGSIENGSRVELVQHVSQINMLLIAIRKADPDKPAHRIGYQLPDVEDD